MPVFLFYPQTPDGACLTFVSASLADDAEAVRHAAQVLADHASADEVAVWQGERLIAVHGRDSSATPPAIGHVLLVEDCFFQAETFKLAFREAGFAVACASGEADAAAQLQARTPDIALVDIDLGDGPSFAVAETLEAQKVPFLFVTGYDRAILPARWRHIGHVCKPVMGSQVVEAAKAVINPSPLAA
ncbi:response regulator [Caulobacter segnis]|nr:response regulator [Caulobacter segnis]